MTIVLTETDAFDFDARGAAEGLVLSAADAETAIGWTLKPEGMCRDDLCVPMPQSAGNVDVAAFWRKLGHPVASSGGVWSLGTGVAARQASLAGLQAPDFVLADLAGRSHRLSDLRGKKVFLSTWASW